MSYGSEQELDGHLSSVKHMRRVQGKTAAVDEAAGQAPVVGGGNWTQQSRSRTTASHHEGLRKMLQESEVPTVGRSSRLLE